VGNVPRGPERPDMTATLSPSVGIDAVTYWLPPTDLTLDELSERGELCGTQEVLASFGFHRARIARNESHVEMAMHAVRALLDESGVAPDEIDLVLYAGALTSSSTMACTPAPDGVVLQLRDVMDFFKYPGSALQSELELTRAAVAGIDQQGCASVLSAVRLGRAMLLAEEDVRAVLCVSADRLPAGAPREMVYNLVSDGACAVLLRRGAPGERVRNRVVACHQVTKGAFWEAGERESEIIAAYFPTARTAVEELLRKAGVTMRDVAWVIPHNVSLRSWEILLRLLDCPRAKLFADNIERIGHTIAADNFINLRDAADAGLLRRGDLLLLFTFGYGLHWSCMLLEH
jgi:3-oxoacyl-[acyl-carrier-protein] synthase III